MFEEFCKTVVIVRIENVVFVNFSLSLLLQLGYILIGLTWFINRLNDGFILSSVTTRSLIDRWQHVLLFHVPSLLNFLIFAQLAHIFLFASEIALDIIIFF